MLTNTLKVLGTTATTTVGIVDELINGANCGLETVKDTVDSLKNSLHIDYKKEPRILILGKEISEEQLFNAIKDIINELSLDNITKFIVQKKSSLEPIVNKIGKDNGVSIDTIQSTLFINKEVFDVVLYIGSEEDNLQQLNKFEKQGKLVFIEPIK